MLQGEELAAALAEAITLKKAVRGFENLGPSRLARDFEIAQSSASEWLKYGRVAKKHIGKLLEYFADVVGPEHWGLPFGKREFNAMLVYRQLPEQMQLDLGHESEFRGRPATRPLIAPPSVTDSPPSAGFFTPPASAWSLRRSVSPGRTPPGVAFRTKRRPDEKNIGNAVDKQIGIAYILSIDATPGALDGESR